MQRELDKLKFLSVFTVISCLLPKERAYFHYEYKLKTGFGPSRALLGERETSRFLMTVWDWNDGVENQEVQNARLISLCSGVVGRLIGAETERVKYHVVFCA